MSQPRSFVDEVREWLEPGGKTPVDLELEYNEREAAEHAVLRERLRAALAERLQQQAGKKVVIDGRGGKTVSEREIEAEIRAVLGDFASYAGAPRNPVDVDCKFDLATHRMGLRFLCGGREIADLDELTRICGGQWQWLVDAAPTKTAMTFAEAPAPTGCWVAVYRGGKLIGSIDTADGETAQQIGDRLVAEMNGGQQ